MKSKYKNQRFKSDAYHNQKTWKVSFHLQEFSKGFIVKRLYLNTLPTSSKNYF